MKDPKSPSPVIIGGVDTHKELHVAAVVDATDTVLATESLSTTRAGYPAMLRWMRSYGDIARVGVECTGSYGAGLMRHLDTAGLDVLEVTAGDKTDRRKRGKDDTIDAEQAAHAAFARVRTVTPRAHNGMVESLRALKIVRKTAIAGRRTALQMIQALIISAPEELRDQLRNMTRMQLIRILAAWRPDLSDYRDPVTATKIALKSLARRYLELHDEIADLEVHMHALVEALELADGTVGRVVGGGDLQHHLLVQAVHGLHLMSNLDAGQQSQCLVSVAVGADTEAGGDGVAELGGRVVIRKPAEPGADGPGVEPAVREVGQVPQVERAVQGEHTRKHVGRALRPDRCEVDAHRPVASPVWPYGNP